MILRKKNTAGGIMFPECRLYYQLTVNKVKVKSLSRVQLFVTPSTVDYQVPLSMGFSRQEYWSGLPFPPPADLPDPGTEPGSPALQVDSLPTELSGKPFLSLHGDANLSYLKVQENRGRGTLITRQQVLLHLPPELKGRERKPPRLTWDLPSGFGAKHIPVLPRGLQLSQSWKSFPSRPGSHQRPGTVGKCHQMSGRQSLAHRQLLCCSTYHLVEGNRHWTDTQ